MSKYIDAEKLIERLEEEKQAEYENCGGVNSKTGALQEVQELIASLQQEQRNPNLENEIKAYTETLYHEIFGNGQGTLDEFDWEDITQVIDDTARYFYNLNKNDE